MAWKSSFGKWTPTYVELPKEDDGFVLISTDHNHFDDGSGDFKNVEFGYYNSDENRWISPAIDGSAEIFENVVAWMPLPKPFIDKNLELESEEN